MTGALAVEVMDPHEGTEPFDPGSTP